MNEAYFYDYPLCLHAFGNTPSERINAILAWCYIGKGNSVIGNRTVWDISGLVDQIEKGKLPGGFSKSKREHCALALGESAFGCSGGSTTELLRLSYAAQSHIDYFNKYGKQVYVSMKEPLLFEVLKGKGISWREYSILAAVRSYIGKTRRYAWVARSVIIARTMGYKTEAVMSTELGNRKDNAKPFELHQINYSLDRLHERQFFARVRKDPWHTYFSTRLKQNELETAIATKSDYKADFHKKRIEQNRRFLKRNGAKVVQPDVESANVKTTNVKTDEKSESASLHGVSTPVFTGVSTLCTPLHIHSNIKTESTSGSVLLNEEEGLKSDGAAKANPEATLLRVEAGLWEKVLPTVKAMETVEEFSAPTLAQVREVMATLNLRRPMKHAAAWFEEKGNDPAWSKKNWRNHITKWLTNREGVEWTN